MKNIFCILVLACCLAGGDVLAQEQYPEAMPGISETYYTSFDADNPYATKEMLNHIRREKFDLVLPRVMRERGVDMWIHIIRPWTWSGNEARQLEGLGLNYQNIDSTDPMRYEFGSNASVIVFTDRGGDHIERVVFEGEVEDEGVFDIVRGQSKFINQENYEIMDYTRDNPEDVPGTQLGYRFMGLRKFIADRDPQKIAVNYSEELTLAEGSETYTLSLTDGISFADHRQLTREMGAKYSKRMVSAEHMILDYLTRSVMAEIVVFGGSGKPKKPRSFDKVVPGVTTLATIGGSWFSTREGDHDEEAFSNYPLQQGDMFQIGMDAYYVLHDGETGPPPEILRSWDEMIRVRKILAEHIVPGLTGEEALEVVVQKLEEAGFAYIDRDRFDPRIDPTKTQVHLDLHQVGKGLLVPRISPMGASWQRKKEIPLFLTLGVEYMVHMPVPEWGEGRHIYYCTLHPRAVVTPRGLEFAAPPVAGIQSIH